MPSSVLSACAARCAPVAATGQHDVGARAARPPSLAARRGRGRKPLPRRQRSPASRRRHRRAGRSCLARRRPAGAAGIARSGTIGSIRISCARYRWCVRQAALRYRKSRRSVRMRAARRARRSSRLARRPTRARSERARRLAALRRGRRNRRTGIVDRAGRRVHRCRCRIARRAGRRDESGVAACAAATLRAATSRTSPLRAHRGARRSQQVHLVRAATLLRHGAQFVEPRVHRAQERFFKDCGAGDRRHARFIDAAGARRAERA